MRHVPFEDKLNDLLDRRERPEENAELRALADGSPACRELLVAQQQLFEGLEADEVPQLPDNFAQRVVAQYVASEPAAANVALKTRRSTWLLELAAVAALVVAVVGGTSYFAPTTSDRPNIVRLPQAPVDDESPAIRENTVALQSPRSANDVDATGDSGDGDIAARAGDEDIAAQSASDDVASDDVVAPQRYDELYHAILQRLPTRDGQEDLLALRPQWVDEVALGFRPVAASFGGAINTLRSTLPPSTKDDRPGKPQAGIFDGDWLRGIA